MILMVETRTPNPDISQGEKNLMQWEHDGDSENKSINEWNHEKNVEWKCARNSKLLSPFSHNLLHYPCY